MIPTDEELRDKTEQLAIDLAKLGISFRDSKQIQGIKFVLWQAIREVREQTEGELWQRNAALESEVDELRHKLGLNAKYEAYIG